MSTEKQRVSMNYKSHYNTMTLMQEVKQKCKETYMRRVPVETATKKGVCLCVYECCVTKIRGMLQKLKC